MGHEIYPCLNLFQKSIITPLLSQDKTDKIGIFETHEHFICIIKIAVSTYLNPSVAQHTGEISFLKS